MCPMTARSCSCRRPAPRRGRKGSVELILPLREDDASHIAARVRRAKAAGPGERQDGAV